MRARRAPLSAAVIGARHAPTSMPYLSLASGRSKFTSRTRIARFMRGTSSEHLRSNAVLSHPRETQAWRADTVGRPRAVLRLFESHVARPFCARFGSGG